MAALIPLAVFTVCEATDSEAPAPEGPTVNTQPELKSSGVQPASENQTADSPGHAPTSALLSAGPGEGAATTSVGDANAVSEGIGDIRIGQSADELEKLMGEPSAKPQGAPPAESRIEAVWKYAGQGVTVTLSAAGKDEPLKVESIVADEGCPLRTRRGIGIGSDRAAVVEAYGSMIAPDGVEGFVTVDFAYGFLDLTLKTEEKDGEARELVVGMTLSAFVSFEDGEDAEY
jgi:hypothetical protein